MATARIATPLGTSNMVRDLTAAEIEQSKADAATAASEDAVVPLTDRLAALEARLDRAAEQEVSGDAAKLRDAVRG